MQKGGWRKRERRKYKETASAAITLRSLRRRGGKKILINN